MSSRSNVCVAVVQQGEIAKRKMSKSLEDKILMHR